MERNDNGRIKRNSQGSISAKKLIALILSLAMALGMLCATAEDSDGILLPGGTIQANDGELIIGDGVAGDSAMDLELPEDAMSDEDALAIDGTSLDGLEDNLVADGLAELDIGADAPATTQAGNASDPEDFEIDEDGALVKYVGAGGDVVIPDGVTSIGDRAFEFCNSLTSVTIPDSVASIGEDAFYCCDSLTSVKIPEGVISIGKGAFDSCSGLTSVTIPDSVTSIGDWAFKWCSSLTSVTVGAGVSIDELIGSELFENDAIEMIKVSKNNGVCASEDGVLYTYDMRTLLRCPRAKASVTIPEGVTSIGRYAFEFCSSLTSVTIPDSVTSIGKDAFWDCRSLTSVMIPDSVTSIGERAFAYCRNLTSVTIPNSVTSIQGYTFLESGLTTVTIPNGVTDIGKSAFACCYNLSRVVIPDSLKRIEYCAFGSCYSLTSITIPNGVEYINEWSFARESVIDEGSGVFCDKSAGLLDITIHGNNGSYAEKYAKENGILFAALDAPTATPTPIPTATPTPIPTATPTPIPTATPTAEPTVAPTATPTAVSTVTPTSIPTATPTATPTVAPTATPTAVPTVTPTPIPTATLTATPIPTSTPTSTANPKISLSDCKLTVKAQVYTGKALKPAVKVVLKGKTLKKGADYTVSYKNNKAVGTATVTVAGKGDYKGTAKATFKINPKAVTGLKLTAGKGKLTASWKKLAGGVGGYQLQYALKKSFAGGKKVTISRASTLKATLKKLKAGKIYYVRIRTYKKVGKTTYWSAWSEAKKAKVK